MHRPAKIFSITAILLTFGCSDSQTAQPDHLRGSGGADVGGASTIAENSYKAGASGAGGTTGLGGSFPTGGSSAEGGSSTAGGATTVAGIAGNAGSPDVVVAPTQRPYLELSTKIGAPPLDVAVKIGGVSNTSQTKILVDGVETTLSAAGTVRFDSVGIHAIAAHVTVAGQELRASTQLVTVVVPELIGQATIDASGGTIDLGTDASPLLPGAKLVIPPGAVGVPTTIRVTYDPLRASPDNPRQIPLVLEPHGISFQVPVTLRVPGSYGPYDVDCDPLRYGVQLVSIDEGGMPDRKAAVDCVAGTVDFALSHFSTHAVEESRFSFGAFYGLLTDTFNEYRFIYDTTVDATSTASKAIDRSHDIVDLMSLYLHSDAAGDQLELLLRDPVSKDSQLTLDAAVNHAYTMLAIHSALNRNSGDPQADFAAAMNLLSYYREQDTRSRLVAKYLGSAVDWFSSSPIISTYSSLITAQIEVACKVLKAWDDSALYLQYDRYRQGRSAEHITWSEEELKPKVVVDTGDYAEYILESFDPTCAPDTCGWFALDIKIPSLLKKSDRYHWQAFELLYSAQSAGTAELQTQLRNVLQRLVDRAQARQTVSGSGWTWGVTTSPATALGESFSSSALDVKGIAPVNLAFGEKFHLDLSTSEGSPEWIRYSLSDSTGRNLAAYKGWSDFRDVLLYDVPPPVAVGDWGSLLYPPAGDYTVEARVRANGSTHVLQVPLHVLPSPRATVVAWVKPVGPSLSVKEGEAITIQATGTGESGVLMDDSFELDMRDDVLMRDLRSEYGTDPARVGFTKTILLAPGKYQFYVYAYDPLTHDGDGTSTIRVEVIANVANGGAGGAGNGGVGGGTGSAGKGGLGGTNGASSGGGAGNGGSNAVGGGTGSSMGSSGGAGGGQPGSGGTLGNTGGAGGTTGAGGMATGGIAATGGATVVVPNSCLNLTTQCQGESCCTSITVPGNPAPAAPFRMGRSEVTTASDYFSAGGTLEIPEHDATVASFALDKYEVTVGRVRKFVDAYDTWHVTGGNPVAGTGANPNVTNTGWRQSWTAAAGNLPVDSASLTSLLKCNATSQTWTDIAGSNEAYPITCVSWYMAFAFCIWDGGRLPTEAEWEYAAAGGASNNYLYPWGIAAPSSTLANYRSCTGCLDSPFVAVGSYPAGNAAWGHADLAGSMSEWVFDWYATTYYGTTASQTTCNNCANAIPSDYRILRGGGWWHTTSSLRAVSRIYGTPGARSDGYGFRCSRTP